jgi:hypothetical protein
VDFVFHGHNSARVLKTMINMEMRKRKFGWIGHTPRKDKSEPCKAAVQWNPQVARRMGRPRNSWRRTTLNECGKRSWIGLRFIVRNREGWKIFLDNLCSYGTTDFIIIIVDSVIGSFSC